MKSNRRDQTPSFLAYVVAVFLFLLLAVYMVSNWQSSDRMLERYAKQFEQVKEK